MAMKTPLTMEERRREHEMLGELKKFHRENTQLDSPLAAQLTKKRLRVPHVDPETNPFCMDRQLADQYQLQNFNKNPRYYIHTIKDSSRMDENPRNYSSFINQSADLMASSCVSPRMRAEFTSCTPAASYQPAQFITPAVVSVDTGNLRHYVRDGTVQSPNGVDAATHQQYSTQRSSQTVTFGHRPNSASRMYDPTTSTVLRTNNKTTRDKTSTSIKTGMSVMQLTELLTPSKKAIKSTANDAKKSKDQKVRDSDQIDTHRSANSKTTEELERGYQSTIYNPPRVRKAIQFLPPTDQTTAQLIDKYRKLAVGKLPTESTS